MRADQLPGEILTPRSGFVDRRDIASRLPPAAEMDATTGRAWRPLEDTTTAAQVLYGAGSDYERYRRSGDFYSEGTLIWLEIDVAIRQLSKGARSLDDFCRAFHGGPSGAPAMKTYNFEDVVAALNAVQANDWAGFLTAVCSPDRRAPRRHRAVRLEPCNAACAQTSETMKTAVSDRPRYSSSAVREDARRDVPSAAPRRRPASRPP